MFDAKVYRVLIASPSDLESERRVARDAIHEWNVQHAIAESVVLLPIMWETHGRPQAATRSQEALNQQFVRDSDILIGMFWTKIGTPTVVAESGTAEEIDQFVAAKKPALLYFSDSPVKPSRIDLEQYAMLQEFKAETYTTAFVGSFESSVELHQKLLRDLMAEVRKLRPKSSPDPELKPVNLDQTWRERDQLELYVIAYLSVGREPSLPVDKEPELSRFRLLKDAIKRNELQATLSPTSPDTPDVWATVTREELEKFAHAKRNTALLNLVKQWAGVNSKDPSGLLNAVRLQLAQLRTQGVELRNAAFDLASERMKVGKVGSDDEREKVVNKQCTQNWISQTEGWNQRVQETIALCDLPDAEWFRTLDTVPPPRIPLWVKQSDMTDQLQHNYAMHDRRLDRLDQLIRKYAGIT